MTPPADPTSAGGPQAAPDTLLAALRASAGSLVDGASAAGWADAPDTSGLSASRTAAVLAAWTGARLHAGAPGLLAADDPDVALLVGDWCYAHALQALAHEGDLHAIGALATAIGTCATALAELPEPGPARLEQLARAWAALTDGLRAE